MEGKVCSRCGIWKPLEEYNKDKTKKDGRCSTCRECKKEYNKQWRRNNPEYQKQWRRNNPGYCKDYFNSEQQRQYREKNKERIKELNRQYYQNNKKYRKEYIKQYKETNKEHYKELNKQYHKDKVENNLQYISSIVEQVRPIFKELNLPIYGTIYKITNTETGHIYIGQTTTSLKHRYNNDIIKGWIKERLEYDAQKFSEELMEENFIATEVLDVGVCKYHLDKLEVYYIDKYDSYNNGYNNTAGNHITNDGLEKFIEILQQYNLEFVDGQIVKRVN